MKEFRKNVLRGALRNKASFIGSILIIAIGIFCMVAMFDTLRNLQDQVYAYYENYAMGDVFAEVSGISAEDLQRLTGIPGMCRNPMSGS